MGSGLLVDAKTIFQKERLRVRSTPLWVKYRRRGWGWGAQDEVQRERSFHPNPKPTQAETNFSTSIFKIKKSKSQIPMKKSKSKSKSHNCNSAIKTKIPPQKPETNTDDLKSQLQNIKTLQLKCSLQNENKNRTLNPKWFISNRRTQAPRSISRDPIADSQLQIQHPQCEK